jgi:aryl-alcohol dehydrogenase-like predicted oxidoreductase
MVGGSKEEQLDDIFAAIDLKLSDEVMTAVHKVTKEILYPMG